VCALHEQKHTHPKAL